MNRLEGKIALISGGTTGMGATIAKRFQTEGATVIATGANPETLEKAKEELPGVEFVASDASNIEAMIEELDANEFDLKGPFELHCESP